MNNGIDSFLWTMIVAFLFQNVVFARGFGTGRIIKVTEDSSLILPYAGVITLSTAVAGLAGWCVSLFEIEITVRMMFEPLIFIGAMTALYVVSRTILHRINTSWARKAYVVMSPAIINTTVLGTVMVAFRANYSLVQYMGLSVGTGLGFAAAAFILYSGFERIDDSDIGPAFRGLPIKILYIGIIAIGIYGFIGKSILL